MGEPRKTRKRMVHTTGPTVAQVGAMVAAGMSADHIANHFGIDVDTAAGLMSEWADTLNRMTAPQYRAVLGAQYRHIQARQALAANDLANKGLHREAAAATVLQMKAMNALRELEGLDAPQQFDITSGGQPVGVTADELAAYAASIRATIVESQMEIINVEPVGLETPGEPQ